MIEKQIYRKFILLKSYNTKKYICFNISSKKFVMKVLREIDSYCVFILSINSMNDFIFTIGSKNSIGLSFDEFGIINNFQLLKKKKFKQKCQASKRFSIHTKFTDLMDNFSFSNN